MLQMWLRQCIASYVTFDIIQSQAKPSPPFLLRLVRRANKDELGHSGGWNTEPARVKPQGPNG